MLTFVVIELQETLPFMLTTDHGCIKSSKSMPGSPTIMSYTSSAFAAAPAFKDKLPSKDLQCIMVAPCATSCTMCNPTTNRQDTTVTVLRLGTTRRVGGSIAARIALLEAQTMAQPSISPARCQQTGRITAQQMAPWSKALQSLAQGQPMGRATRPATYCDHPVEPCLPSATCMQAALEEFIDSGRDCILWPEYAMVRHGIIV